MQNLETKVSMVECMKLTLIDQNEIRCQIDRRPEVRTGTMAHRWQIPIGARIRVQVFAVARHQQWRLKNRSVNLTVQIVVDRRIHRRWRRRRRHRNVRTTVRFRTFHLSLDIVN